MKFNKQYLGKWVAVKEDRVVESGKTLSQLMKKVSTKNGDKLKFTLIPRGYITG